MQNLVVRIGRGAAVLGLMCSPALLVYLVPAAIGFGLDIADLCSPRWAGLGLTALLGLALLLSVRRRVRWERLLHTFSVMPGLEQDNASDAPFFGPRAPRPPSAAGSAAVPGSRR